MVMNQWHLVLHLWLLIYQLYIELNQFIIMKVIILILYYKLKVKIKMMIFINKLIYSQKDKDLILKNQLVFIIIKMFKYK